MTASEHRFARAASANGGGKTSVRSRSSTRKRGSSGSSTDRDVALRVVGRRPRSGGDARRRGRLSRRRHADARTRPRRGARADGAGAGARRVPIVVRENELVRMLAQADVARVGRRSRPAEVGEAISQPPGGPRVAGSGADDGSNVGVRESSLEQRDRSSPVANAPERGVIASLRVSFAQRRICRNPSGPTGSRLWCRPARWL